MSDIENYNSTKFSKIFRDEVLPENQLEFSGKITIGTPIAIKIASWFSIILIILVISILYFSSWTRVIEVGGTLRNASSAIILSSNLNKNSILENLYVSEGNYVAKGEELASFFDAQGEDENNSHAYKVANKPKKLLAPFDGLILKVYLSIGNRMEMGAPLLLIRPSDGTIQADFTAPLYLARYINVGDKLDVFSETNQFSENKINVGIVKKLWFELGNDIEIRKTTNSFKMLKFSMTFNFSDKSRGETKGEYLDGNTVKVKINIGQEKLYKFLLNDI